MCQPEPAQHTPDGGTMQVEIKGFGQLSHQLIERDLALEREASGHPRQLAVSAIITLSPHDQSSGLAPQIHQIVDEFRRHTKVPGRLSVPVTIVAIGHHPGSRFCLMWVAHMKSLYLP